MRKKILVLIALCFALLCGVNISYAADGGSFVISATSSDKVVIEPCRISWTDGQTIRDALKSSGHEFEGIDEDWITAIDGEADNYNRYYDGGQYNLDAPASSVKTAMVFTVNEYSNTDGILELVKLLADHKDMPSSVKKFKAVETAYEAAVDRLAVTDAAGAQSLADNLKAAYKQYEDWQNQDTTEVTVNAIQGNSSANAEVTLVDQAGNEYKGSGESCSFQLLPEKYEFKVVKANCETTGSFNVAENEGSKVLDIMLPDGQWFGNIAISDTDKVQAQSTTEGSETNVLLQDTTYSPFINVRRGADLPDGALLYADYTGFNNETYYGDESNNSYRKSWESTSAKLVQAVPAGLETASVKLKAIVKDEDSGYTQRVYHTINIEKKPTLKGLTVNAGKSKIALSPEFDVRTNAYQVETTADTLTISGETYVYNSDKLAACGKYSEGYSIEINGESQAENSSVDVQVEEGYVIPVTVIGSNGQRSEYSIRVGKLEPGNIEVIKPAADLSVNLISSTGSEIEPDSENSSKAVFNVAPGTYTWVTTLDEYYHASGTVKLDKNQTETVTVEGAMPVKEELLKGFGAFSASTDKAVEYKTVDGEEFNWQKHEYKYAVNDFVSTFYVKASYSSGVSVKRGAYKGYDGSKISVGNLTNGTKTIMSKFIGRGGINNTATVTASKTSSGITYYQDYFISTSRNATLDSLEIRDEAGNVYVIEQDVEDGEAEFDADINDYVMSIGETAERIEVTAGFSCPVDEISDTGDYTITIGSGKFVKSKSEKKVTQKIDLDMAKAEEEVIVKVENENTENTVREYRITIRKVPPVTVKFNLNAENGNTYVIDELSGREVAAEEDGSFRLMKNFRYTYVATAYGYVGVKESFKADCSETININLEKAADNNAIDKNISAQWPYFRADTNNNGVVDVPTPIKAEDTTLYWATQVGEGYSGNATGCPIMADGCLYTYSGKTIYKIDSVTGEVLETGDMVRGSSFAINSPTYAEGMIFVGLSNGCVQAFNAKTLESVWVYNDSLGGQPNCQLTYEDGYLYTGFWNSETKEANFVCISVTDENPSKRDEEKLATWTHTGAGYYWAGAFASNKYVLVGTDDGKVGYSDGYGTLLSMDPATGKVIDSIENEITGDIRSSICYDTDTDKYYFTSKDGLFCSFKMNEDGSFNRNSLTKLQLYAKSEKKGMSTSTPVIKNGRAYVGVSGVGQFTMYSGHNITVIDLTGSSPKIAYSVETQGYPQTSGLLTTAYGKEDKSVYVYFFDNFTPGKLRVLKDKPGQTEPDEETLETESYESSGNTIDVTTAKSLFTPFGDQAQYAICSPIVDEWGNIYFKNDSAYMMMIGATITKLEVTKQPDKLNYRIGEKFNPSGMQVTATYSNGKSRDITKYVSFTDEPLTEDDTEIDIIFDLGQNMKMYQNVNGEPGTDFIPPQTSVSVSIGHGHDYVPYTKKAGYCKNGESGMICSECGEKDPNSVKILPGYSTNYVKSFKVAKAKKAFTAKWKKQTAANKKNFTGYQIQYSLNSNMSSAKTAYATKSSKSKKISKLLPKKKYFVRARTYRTVGGVKYYSSWSAKKSVVTK